MKKDTPLKKVQKLGITFKPSPSGQGGQLTNSYRISNTRQMEELADYLMNHSSFSSYLAGSVEGFVHEWEIHNLAYTIGTTTKDDDMVRSAKHLDIGKTIYSDSHGFKSALMIWLFEVRHPFKSKEDKEIYDNLN